MTITATTPPATTGIDVCIAPPAIAMAWLGPGRPHETVAVPGVRLERGEVLVEVELATVCGSDVHTTEGRRSAATPLVLGHEYVGRITAINGEPRAVDGARLQAGDRVVWSIMASCGLCDRCRRGIPQKCRSILKYGHERIADRWELNGGFATHVHLRAGTAVVKVGETLPPEVLAPASCGTATAWAAVDRADQVVDVDSTVVLITGAGLIGLTAAAIAADRGARVIVSDPDPARAALARRFGAVAAVDPTDSGSLQRALAGLDADEIEVAIEASGSVRAVEFALAHLAVGGVAVLVGSVFPGPSITIDPERVVRDLLTIRGVHNYTGRDLVAAVGYLRERGTDLPFAELIGERFRLTDIDRALRAAGPGGPVRVAVVANEDRARGAG